LGFVLNCSFSVFAEDGFHAGLLYDDFPLTLAEGNRTEALGPFFYDQQKDTESTWAIPPLFSHDTDPGVESREDDFLYPVLTYEKYGKEYRWQFFQLLSFSGGHQQNGTERRRFTLFPIYFQQRSTATNENYTALFPIYGHLQNRFWRDQIFFVLFPLFGETHKRDVVTENILFPIFATRHGDGLEGWKFWPLFGAENKVVTYKTNNWGEVETIGGHDRYFVLWPIHFWQNNGIGTDNPSKFRATLPLYTYTRSPKLDSTTVLWPFFSWIDQREKKYREWQGPWPIVIFARGEGKTTDRVWPLFSQNRKVNVENKSFVENDSYLWPLYRHREVHADPLEQIRNSVLWYIYIGVDEKNTATGMERKRRDMWPFFIWRRDFNGNERFQILALLEPVLPNNRGIDRNWSPLWSLWRSEHNAKTGAASQSFLWNLYRRDTKPGAKKCSLLFGLFQYQSEGESRRLRLFYIPVMKTHPSEGQSAK
jgi:hypothetical protein